MAMADTEVEMSITVGEGKYTFFIFKGDYRIHCWRYAEPWMVFAQGHKAISSLMYEYQDLENKMTKQSMDNGVPDCPECGGKGMCIEHRVELLRYEYKVARDAYEFVMNEYIKILKLRISKNAYRDELNLQNSKTNPEPKTERNQK